MVTHQGAALSPPAFQLHVAQHLGPSPYIPERGLFRAPFSKPPQRLAWVGQHSVRIRRAAPPAYPLGSGRAHVSQPQAGQGSWSIPTPAAFPPSALTSPGAGMECSPVQGQAQHPEGGSRDS